jgi:hypothetical protein
MPMAWAMLRWNVVNVAAVAALCALPVLGIKFEGRGNQKFTTTDTSRALGYHPGEVGVCRI